MAESAKFIPKCCSAFGKFLSFALKNSPKAVIKNYNFCLELKVRKKI